MSILCPYCGEDAVIEDTHGTNDQTFCAECGCVIEEAKLTSSSMVDTGQFVSARAAENSAKHSERRLIKECLYYIESVGKAVLLSPDYVEEASDLFSRACSNYYLKSKHLQFKHLLSVVCVYLTCRMHSVGISLWELSKLTKTNTQELGSIYLSVCDHLALKIPFQSIGALSKKFLGERHFNMEVLTLSHQILQLCDKFWLVTGRHPMIFLSAAVYLAWKVETRPVNLKVTPQEFCRRFKMYWSKTMLTRIKEIEKVFSDFAVQLPWVKQQPTRGELLFLLPDILKYQNSLSQKLLHAFELSDDNAQLAVPPSMKKRKVVREEEIVSIDGCVEDVDYNVEEYIRTEQEVEELREFSLM